MGDRDLCRRLPCPLSPDGMVGLGTPRCSSADSERCCICTRTVRDRIVGDGAPHARSTRPTMRGGLLPLSDLGIARCVRVATAVRGCCRPVELERSDVLGILCRGASIQALLPGERELQPRCHRASWLSPADGIPVLLRVSRSEAGSVPNTWRFSRGRCSARLVLIRQRGPTSRRSRRAARAARN